MVKPWPLLLLAVLLLGSVPVIERPVTDLRELLPPGEEELVASSLVQLRQQTGVQMAVLLVGTTGGTSIEDYSLEVAEAWKGGRAGGKDDGLLFVLAVDDRRMRLEVGYGLEERLPDDAVRQLLDAQGPLLRQKNYTGALLGVIGGVRARLQGVEDVSDSVAPHFVFSMSLAVGCAHRHLAVGRARCELLVSIPPVRSGDEG